MLPHSVALFRALELLGDLNVRKALPGHLPKAVSIHELLEHIGGDRHRPRHLHGDAVKPSSVESREDLILDSQETRGLAADAAGAESGDGVLGA